MTNFVDRNDFFKPPGKNQGYTLLFYQLVPVNNFLGLNCYVVETRLKAGNSVTQICFQGIRTRRKVYYRASDAVCNPDWNFADLTIERLRVNMNWSVGWIWINKIPGFHRFARRGSEQG